MFCPTLRNIICILTTVVFVFVCRRLWAVGRGAHRVAAGEVAVRPGGVLPDAVPQPADPIREAVAPAAVAAHGQLASHRATVLRPAGGQDAHRDAHPGHAAQRQQLQLAVHQLHVTLRLEADDRDACLVVIAVIAAVDPARSPDTASALARDQSRAVVRCLLEQHVGRRGENSVKKRHKKKKDFAIQAR